MRQNADWKGMKFQYRWKMDNHNGWTFRDGDILINIDGPHGLIRTTPSRDLRKKEAAAFLKAKGIPYETSINGLHECDWDSWYFDEDKECYICDWGMPYTSALAPGQTWGVLYRNQGVHRQYQIQMCNFCKNVREINRGRFINWPLDPPRIGGDS